MLCCIYVKMNYLTDFVLIILLISNLMQNATVICSFFFYSLFNQFTEEIWHANKNYSWHGPRAGHVPFVCRASCSFYSYYILEAELN